jgi:hypothetical protein
MNIEIDSSKDHTVNTVPIIQAPLNTNIIVDTVASEPQDSDSENDFGYLVNKKKVAPPKAAADYDSDTGKSVKSHKSKKSEDSEYKPRTYAASEPTMVENVANSFLKSGVFDYQREHVMTEDDIRREKSYMLHQYESRNIQNRYSTLNLTMNNSLDEIRNELEYINNKRDMENNMINWKQGMYLVLNGMVELNQKYDPFDVDLTNWRKDIHFELMREGKYDDVLQELIMKWKGKMPITPELKLLGMIGMSLGSGVFAAKQAAAEKAKRKREEINIKEKVQEEFEKMKQEMQKEMRKEMYQQQPVYTRFAHEDELRSSSIPEERSVSRINTFSPKMQGPSINVNDDAILELVKQDFMDSTIDDATEPIVHNGDNETIEGTIEETSTEKRKGAGRPKGSPNKKKNSPLVNIVSIE